MTSNVLRAIVGFVTSVVIARALNPAGYGDLMFLLGSFVAIRSLLDMGSSNAFFTFLSQRVRGKRFYGAYFLWLVFQFAATLALIGLFFPTTLLEKIWIGHNRELILLAFVATFIQQQLWQTVGYVGEAMRKTVLVQIMNLTVALVYLAVVLLVAKFDQLTVEKVLFVLVVQYAVATALAYKFLKVDQSNLLLAEKSFVEIFKEYWAYCKPLFLVTLVSFSCEFADKWLLQKFGGATQQGYFQIASQFAAVSLLATISILNIFWKEIANSWAKQDLVRVAMLYRKVNRGLVLLGAMISGFLFPWSEQIVVICLGEDYAKSWPIFAVMLLYPIHQSMGRIGTTMFLACGQTHRHMLITISMLLIFMPASYIVLAPSSGEWLSGLEMGAFGMACKMVVMGIVAVNIQAWVIARYAGWKFDWTFQIVGIPIMMLLGFAAKSLVETLWSLKNVSIDGLLVPVIAACFLYVFMALAVVWWLPWLIGSDREDLVQYLS